MASPKTYGPFPLGMDNRLSGRDLEALDPGTRNRVPLLRSTVNIDVDKEGRLKRRKGCTLLRAATQAHSLWAPKDSNVGYYVDGSALIRVTVNGSTSSVSTIRNDMAIGRPVSFEQVGADVYYTNGAILDRIDGPYAQAATPADPATEAPLTTKMPPGSIVRYHAGRLLIARDNFVFYSEPYAGWDYDPVRGFIPFPETVTVVQPCEGGTYIVADKVYWMAGEIGSAEARVVSPTRGVLGTGGTDPDRMGCWWFGTDGLMRGNEAGEVVSLTTDRVAVSGALSGASALIERDGMKQHVTSTFGPSSTTLAANSFMDAEIVRKETQL